MQCMINQRNMGDWMSVCIDRRGLICPAAEHLNKVGIPFNTLHPNRGRCLSRYEITTRGHVVRPHDSTGARVLATKSVSCRGPCRNASK